MDAKYLKHRKNSKRSKNVTCDKNTNVLVVPPDILKKLGININPPAQQITNHVNFTQSPEVNKTSQINNFASSCTKKGNESSIQETADLMKKSVFLSPTFVDTVANTVANLISGEVEFSSTKSLNDFEIDRSPLENIQVTNDPISGHGEIKNGAPTIPIISETMEKSRNQGNTHLNLENSYCIPNHAKELSISPKLDHNSTQEDNHIVNKISIHHLNIDENKEAITTEPAELVNQLISLQGYDLLDEEANKHFITFEMPEELNSVVVNGKEIDVVYVEPNLNIIPPESSNELTINSEIGNNLMSLVTGEDVNEIISTKKNVNIADDAGKVGNLIPLEGCSVQIQLTESESNLGYSKDSANMVVDASLESNLIPTGEDAIQINQFEDENKIMSSNELINEITLPDTENNFIYLAENVQFKQVDADRNVISSGKVQEDETEIPISVSSLKDNFDIPNNCDALEEMKAEVNQKNTIINQVCIKSKHLEAEQFENNENMIKKNDYGAKIIDKNEIFVSTVDTIQNIEVETHNNSVETLSFTENVFVKQLLKEQTENTLDKIINSNISANGLNGEVNLINLRKKSENVNSMVGEDMFDNRGQQNSHKINGDIVTPINKMAQEIHIEIITSSISEECRRPQSPITNAKICDFHSLDNITSNSDSYNSELVKSNSTRLANTTLEYEPSASEQMESETVNDNTFPNLVLSNALSENTILNYINMNHINEATVGLRDARKEEYFNSDEKPNNINKSENNETRKFIEKEIHDNEISAKQNNKGKEMTDPEDEKYCEEQINNILKTTKENNIVNMQADKVKEIADCIKKFPHIFMSKNIEKKRCAIKTKNDKTEGINVKTTSTKSKLCIQGVEKPGGNLCQKKPSGDTKIYKTYTRQKKRQHLQTSRSHSYNNEIKSCTVHDSSDSELNTVNVLISSKTQDFCLCYDFGYLYDCHNTYEHIHFWLHNNNTDLESIFSIYNDDENIYTDRTQLDCVKLSQTHMDDTIIGDICWNYLRNDQCEENCQTSDKSQVMKNSGVLNIVQSVTGCHQNEHKNSNSEISDQISEQSVINNKTSLVSKDIDKAELEPNKNPIHTTIAENINFKTEANVSPGISMHNQKCQSSNKRVLPAEVDKDGVGRVDESQVSLKGSNTPNEGSSKEKTKVHSDTQKKKSAISEPSNKKYLDAVTPLNEKESNSDNKTKDGSLKNKKVTLSEAITKNVPDGVRRTDESLLCLNESNKPKEGSSKEKTKLHPDTQKEKPTISEPGNKKSLDGVRRADESLICLKESNTPKEGSSIEKTKPHPDAQKKKPTISEPSNKKSLKRSLPDRISLDNVSREEPPSKKNVKCGVCDALLAEAEWEQHVSEKHYDIAWRAGSSLAVDDPELLKKLQLRLSSVGKVKCPRCNMQTKKMEKLLLHLKQCLGLKESSARRGAKIDTVICGVCKDKVEYRSWFEHIGREHNYLAWINGQNPLNTNDEIAVLKHLKAILKSSGSLDCYKCGMNRKRAQLYLEHMKNCTSNEPSPCVKEGDSMLDRKNITCGVCKQEVHVVKWMEHISREHNYLAWEEGSIPLDVNNEEAVWNHLQEIIRQNQDGLICYKCGLFRRRVKLYLSHIETCDGKEKVQLFRNTSVADDAKDVDCGVCKAKVPIPEWNEHIGKEHNYLAWRADTAPLDVNDEVAVIEHLLEIIRSCGYLICYKCGLKRKRAKLYLAHLRNCDGIKKHGNEPVEATYVKSEVSDQVEITIEDTIKIVTCAVCNQDVATNMWIEHIGREHQYLAWQKGADALDITDEDAVKIHLMNISRENDGLICNKCKVVKKYPKTFQQHTIDCDGTPPISDINSKMYEPHIDHFDVSDVKTDTVTCGVCEEEIKTSIWMTHIRKKHNYIAWFVGKPPIDVNDPFMVQKHLIEVTRRVGELKCNKCGVVRKYAKKFMDHVATCKAESRNLDFAENVTNNGPVKCGVCAETVDSKEWRNHAMNKHYNVAWIVGEPPIEINLPYVVEPYIKEYQQRNNNKLICKTCQASRVSAVGFYAHIITCGKTEEETEIYKGLCNICNNKYLLIYKSQHMTMHKEKEISIERKLLIAKEKERKLEEFDQVEVIGGRRRAAEKAITVIEKYTTNVKDGTHCSSCGFHSEIKSEMASHVCIDIKYEDSDSDVSIDLDHGTSDDDDSDVNSNISEEEREAQEQEQARSKKHADRDVYKIQRLPYRIRNIHTYMRKCAQQFAELHLTDEDLFTEWRKLEYEIVPDADVTKYMPPLEESCKVTYNDKIDWIAYKRFEAVRKRDIITMFTGACIQSICWVPSHKADNGGATSQYLSVITHLATDVPRHSWQDIPAQNPALIQIWDCKNLICGVPEFVMGLALDYGTIWSMDWCPSGSRDVDIKVEESNQTQRLGLLAVACSNGSAYILAVPYPPTLQTKDHVFCKLKPVVELRLAMTSNRQVYQATAIKWSTQKGHSHIIVGYGDGTTAHFDLNIETPLLRSTDNGVTIIYPYYDERAQGMCIEDVDVFPTVEGARGPGPVASGSVGGVGARSGPVDCVALHAHSAAARVLYPPHWPAPLMAGDDNLVSQAVNELEWYGCGRRVGGMRACCGCAWCGRVALSSAPLVRLVRTHPAFTDLHRQVIALVQMVPLRSKRKRMNDELSMVLEPLTYADAVLKYGIEFKHITAKDKATQQQMTATPRETVPERFPLSDISSMMFCPTSVHHQKLAMGLHAGLIFIINV